MVAPRRLSFAVLVLSAVLGLLTGVAVVVLATEPEPVREVAFDSPAVGPEALRVLRAWDVQRSLAYARADGAALARLYVPGSRAGAADRALLRGFRERGLRVTGMRTQVLSATLLRESGRRIVLLVTDVLTDAVAEDRHDLRVPLPCDRPSTRRVVLVRTDDVWQVAEAYAVD